MPDLTFLDRWSRLKRQPASAKPDSSPAIPELPPLDSLDYKSDFRAFMDAGVDAGVRRAALKKLFSDPRFNVMDGLDVYIEDYSKEDPIPPGMRAQLQHARTTLLGPNPEEATQPPEIAEAQSRPRLPEELPEDAGEMPASSMEVNRRLQT